MKRCSKEWGFFEASNQIQYQRYWKWLMWIIRRCPTNSCWAKYKNLGYIKESSTHTWEDIIRNCSTNLCREHIFSMTSTKKNWFQCQLDYIVLNTTWRNNQSANTQIVLTQLLGVMMVRVNFYYIVQHNVKTTLHRPKIKSNRHGEQNMVLIMFPNLQKS